MFLIACQKETVKERGLICYLYSYLHLEGVEVVAEDVVILGLRQHTAGIGQAAVQLGESPCSLTEHRQILAECNVSIFLAVMLHCLRKLLL